MSFILSKLVWAVLTPGTLLLIIVATAWATHRRYPLCSRGLLLVATVFLAALSISPIGSWVLRPLESQYPAGPTGDLPVDGIIVLGGGLDAEGSVLAGIPTLNDAAERLTTFVALARAYPKARLVFSGGSGDPLSPSIREADQVKALFSSLGLAPERVIYERDSRNTYENALYSKKLIQPQAGQRWLLVTSAWHMPRAVGCFEKAGWQITPYPVDFRSSSQAHWAMFLPERQLDMVTIGVREWIGLVSYRLMDWI
jgi:uncharacterized SAM-binding protein YcdF (DUF218 family)